MSQRKTYTVQLTDEERSIIERGASSVFGIEDVSFVPAESPPLGAVEVRVPVTMSENGDAWSACGSSSYESDREALKRVFQLLADEDDEQHAVTLVAHVMPPGRRTVPEVAARVEEVKP